jgi:hypothetical protein
LHLNPNLYAMATAKHKDIICFAHVTNQIA